uniref:Ligand dependent nuclear receptor corepressor-like n=1 Tax=Xiphophorus maculatus TaxID=8083 RepID=M4A5T3_XIPMA
QLVGKYQQAATATSATGLIMAAVQCTRCMVERKGFRRELDSWRHRLIHFVGMKSYHVLVFQKQLSCFDCEPDELDDWSAEASLSTCSFCNLPLDKLNLQVAFTSSSLFHHTNCQLKVELILTFISIASLCVSDVTLDCDPKIPLVAHELMKKMIHKFAEEYASKCLLRTTTNGVTRPSSPVPETSDAPLDLTVNRTDGVLDLSNRNSTSSATTSSNSNASGRQHKPNECIERSWELSERLLSKALKDIRSGRLQEQRAALLYGIPLQTLRQGLESWTDGKLGVLHQLKQGGRDYRDEATSHNAMASTLGGEARLVLQKVAACAEQAEIGGGAEENSEFTFPSSTLVFYKPSGQQKTLPYCLSQLRNALQRPTSPPPSLGSPTSLRIPQVRSVSVSAENCSTTEDLHQSTSLTESTASLSSASARPLSFFKLRSPLLAQGCSDSASQIPHRLGPRRSSLDEPEDGCRDKDKQPRKKRGRYRQYNHELMEEAITMVMAGRMSVSKAQGVYGVPHSTLEYKVKERTGTLKNPPKKKSATVSSSSSNLSGSGTKTNSSNSGSLALAVDTKSF